MRPMIGDVVTVASSTAPCLGWLAVDDVHDLAVLGTFTPGPDFTSIEPLVREYEEIINDQIFSLLDEFAAKFVRLGLRLVSADGQFIGSVNDLQICSDDGGTLVRLEAAPAALNGAAGGVTTTHVA